MQSIKEKLSDMNAMRKAKNEAKEEENAEKDLAKARMEVAHEVRMAREAEAQMDMHVNKAAQIAAEHERKHPNHSHHHDGSGDGYSLSSSGQSPTGASGAFPTDAVADEGNPYGSDRETTVAAAGNISGGTTAHTNSL